MKGLLLIALILVALATTFGAVPKTYAYPGQGGNGTPNESGYQRGQDQQAQKEQRDQQERNSTQSSYRR